MFKCNTIKDSHYKLFATEPQPGVFTRGFLLDAVPIIPLKEALATAEMLLLCIPAFAIKQFLHDHRDDVLRASTIVVDCTNATRKGEDLYAAVQELHLTSLLWVKAFNDNGAIVFLQQNPSSKHRLDAKVCGPNMDAVQKVASFAEELGLLPKIVPMDQYMAIRGDQSSVGKGWRHATWFITILFILIMIYTIVQYEQRPGFQWEELPTRVFGKITAWTATWGLAFSLLPGVLARIIKQIRGPQAKLSAPLLWGLNIRKEVGLIALYFLYLHACIMLLIFGPSYYGHLYDKEDGKLKKWTEWSLFMAVVSTSFFSIVGIISFPSVGTAMNKAQFGWVFGPVVYGGLATGLAHIMFLGVESWSEQDNPYSWAGNMPPITLMASLLPLLVLFLKFIQVIIDVVFQFHWCFMAARQGSSDKSSEPPSESFASCDHV
jgi:hypothetical protein